MIEGFGSLLGSSKIVRHKLTADLKQLWEGGLQCSQMTPAASFRQHRENKVETHLKTPCDIQVNVF